MQWILQEFEDTARLAKVLDRNHLHFSLHKVVPFVGQLDPAPEIVNPDWVVMFGSYSMRHYAREHQLTPGVFELRPFLHEHAWQPYLLNGLDSKLIEARFLGGLEPDRDYFIRPLDDSKAIAGAVMTGTEIDYMIKAVNSLKPEEYVGGSLTPDTMLMVCDPVNIQKEWRIWVVNDRIVTYSLYRMGRKVIYIEEIDDDALEFAKQMVAINPKYALGYVLDICRTEAGLHILETNCMNAAGFYAADLNKLVEAIECL